MLNQEVDIEKVKEVVDGRYDYGKKAVFVVFGEKLEDNTVAIDCFANGEIPVMFDAVIEEVAGLIADYSHNQDELTKTLMDFRRYLGHRTHELWEKRTGEKPVMAVLDDA